MVKDFIMMIQEEFTLKHVNFLTSENSVKLLGRTIRRLKNGNITMEFSQKFIDELLNIFEVAGKVTTTGLKLQVLPEGSIVQCDRVIHQKYRSAVGKLLWMAQLRDDLKHPVKELSRSLINPQDQDIKNLVHLFLYVNQTRDFAFVMEPQLPVRNQEGKFPVQIVSYSGSDWAGRQKSRKSRFIPKGQNQFFCQHNQFNQFIVHPTLSRPLHHLHRARRRRCQSSYYLSTSIIKNIFVRDSVKRQDASREFSHLVVEGAEIKENPVFIIVSMSVIMIQKFKGIKNQRQESLNQFKRIQIQLLMISNIFLLLRIKSRRVSGDHGSDHASMYQCH